MGNKKFSLILLFAMLVLPGTGQVQDTYLKGIALSNQGKYREAADLIKNVLSKDKDNEDYLLKLAEINYKSGETEAALGYLQELEMHVPSKGSYLSACIYAASGNAAEAVKYLEQHLSSSYKLPSRIILLQDEFAMIERSREWRTLWSRKWYSEDEELLQEIWYLNKSGEHLQALETIEHSLEDQPDRDELYGFRGEVLMGMQQYQGSVQAYTRAIELNSKTPSYYQGRAKAFLAIDKPENAIADLEKLSRMNPEDLDLLSEIGLIYYQNENFDKASLYLEKYKEYYPENSESRFLLGQVYFDSKKYLDALGEFNACLGISTSDPRFFAARGKTYLSTKTYVYALNDLSMALDLDPKDPEVWYLKGLVRWQLNDRDGSLSDWRSAARLGSYEAAKKLEEHGK